MDNTQQLKALAAETARTYYLLRDLGLSLGLGVSDEFRDSVELEEKRVWGEFEKITQKLEDKREHFHNGALDLARKSPLIIERK